MIEELEKLLVIVGFESTKRTMAKTVNKKNMFMFSAFDGRKSNFQFLSFIFNF